MIAAQGRFLTTKYFASEILQTETNSTCRLCKPYETKETTLLQDAQYWQNNNTLSDTIECVLSYNLTFEESRAKILKETPVSAYTQISRNKS